MKVILGNVDTYLANEHILSEVIGFRLNAIVDEPTCDFPKGSDNSPKTGD
jgi:hypothetical protein